jgi:hypothetical protein
MPYKTCLHLADRLLTATSAIGVAKHLLQCGQLCSSGTRTPCPSYQLLLWSWEMMLKQCLLHATLIVLIYCCCLCCYPIRWLPMLIAEIVAKSEYH